MEPKPPDGVLPRLESVIAARRALPPGSASYVRRLLDGGVPAIAAKIIEEATETVDAAAELDEPGRTHLIREAADLAFHLLVLLACRNVAWAEVESELTRRFGISGLDEKASRTAANSPADSSPPAS